MTRWLVHPVNKITNQEITRRLAERGDGSFSSFGIRKLAEDGKHYEVIAVEYRLLREMYEATKKNGGDFDFLPFKEEDGDEEMEFVPEFLLKKYRSKKVKAAQEFVEQKRGWDKNKQA